jgi:hypothetical protein
VDPVKLLIFVAVFGIFLLVTRRLFSGEQTCGPAPLPPQFPDQAEIQSTPVSEGRGQPAAVGAELDLPLHLPPRERLPGGEYNRPEVSNYYFKKLDLVRGPEDPLVFCDEFCVEFASPEESHPLSGTPKWTMEYAVATPAGLQKMMEADPDHHLFLSGNTVIVPRWDIPELLRIIVQDMTVRYGPGQ